MPLLADFFLTFFASACYLTPGIEGSYLIYTNLSFALAGTSMFPLLCMYFHRLRHRQKFKITHFIWMILPIILFVIGLTLTMAGGTDNITSGIASHVDNGKWSSGGIEVNFIHAYVFFIGTLTRLSILIGAFIALWRLLKFRSSATFSFSILWKFLSGEGSIGNKELQTVLLAVPSATFLYTILCPKAFSDAHFWIALTLSILSFLFLLLFFLFALLNEKDVISRADVTNLMLYNYDSKRKSEVVEELIDELLEGAEQDALLHLQERIGENIQMDQLTQNEVSAVKTHLFATIAGSWDEDLLKRFQTLMLNEQLFLKPSLTLADVAERLDSNKTYVSKMVNNTYNLGFPELLNTLRIDYAEQYILNHPDAKQSEIAVACGFLSASSFNNIFKKITGVTPKMWLASHSK